jgi:predicted aspartyl protease
VTEPVLTIEIEGERYVSMVDTGAMVSLIQPGISKAQRQTCDIKARGVSGTQLVILGEKEVEFMICDRDFALSFIHTFVVSRLTRCSSGILGMDFLQRVGAEISLTSQSLSMVSYSFPLRSRE